jgi:hypothetical protein
MSQRDSDFEENLPLELKLRVLQVELDRLDSDLKWLNERRCEVLSQIEDYEKEISRTERRKVLRRVK